MKYEFKSYDYHTLRLTVFSALNIIWNTFLMSCNFEYISNVLYFSLRSLVSCSHLIGNILEVHEFLMNSDATWKILTIKVRKHQRTNIGALYVSTPKKMVYRVLMGVRRCISGRKYSGGIEIFQFSLTLNFFFFVTSILLVFLISLSIELSISSTKYQM